MQVAEPVASFRPLNDLLFDPDNPRLPNTVRADDDASVIEWMLHHANIIELMGSIGAKGFYAAEPLLVVASATHKDKYEVVEGNRRLTAAKLLQKPSLANTRKLSVLEAAEIADFRPERLPVLIYENRQDILDYLGYRHITGVKAWGALAKARYLRELRNRLDGQSPEQQYRTLARQIGSRPDYVKLLLTAVEVIDKMEAEAYFKIKGFTEDSIDFGVLYTALRKPRLAEFLNLNWDVPEPAHDIDMTRLAEVTRWLFEQGPQGTTRLGESRNLGLLDKVIGNSKALIAFREGRSLSEAALFTDEPHTVFQQLYTTALKQLRDAQATIHLIAKFDQGDYDSTLELAKLARTVHTTVKEQRDSLDDTF